MQKPACLTLDARIRTELFRNYLTEILNGAKDEADYLNAVRFAIRELIAGIGADRGRPGEVPSSAPSKLIAACAPEDVGPLYQDALASRPSQASVNGRWLSSPEVRRKSGIFYTPSSLVEPILDFALGPQLKGKTEPLAICDPACGSGAFLVQACEYISKRIGRPLAEVARESVFGCDVDPLALDIAKLHLWSISGVEIPSGHLRCADSLTSDWKILFPERLGFDAVIGNPPFGGVVDGRVPDEVKSQRSSRFAALGGTSDLAYYFVALAFEITQPSGRIGLVLPRAFLSAPSASNLRRPDGKRLSVLQARRRHDDFVGAAVHVCLIGYEDSMSPSCSDAKADRPDLLNMTISASLIVDEAYRIASHVVDNQNGKHPKLLTTGLIDREASLWGVDLCRFLKSKYKYPRVPSESLSAKRRELASRPKLLVAGLSRQIETFLDMKGEYVGSVGTYSITHPHDDLDELSRAMRYLHSNPVAKTFIEELGPTALGGGNITVTKSFLKGVLASGGF